VKYFNRSVLVIFCLLSLLGVYMAVQHMYFYDIVGGGFLYGDDGSVTGMWDRWEKKDVPVYLVPLFVCSWFFFNAPLWFQVLYFPALTWVGLVYVLPYWGGPLQDRW